MRRRGTPSRSTGVRRSSASARGSTDGLFAPEALERTFATVETYAAVIADLEAEAVRFVATSAARDVDNREQLLEGVRARMGVEAEIISGDEEAQLSYAGYRAGLGR